MIELRALVKSRSSGQRVSTFQRGTHEGAFYAKGATGDGRAPTEDRPLIFQDPIAVITERRRTRGSSSVGARPSRSPRQPTTIFAATSSPFTGLTLLAEALNLRDLLCSD
jgi:hypothetical protein